MSSYFVQTNDEAGYVSKDKALEFNVAVIQIFTAKSPKLYYSELTLLYVSRMHMYEFYSACIPASHKFLFQWKDEHAYIPKYTLYNTFGHLLGLITMTNSVHNGTEKLSM